MGFRVDKSTVVVSGASQGLGRVMADKLHELGAKVIVLARSKDKLDEICQIHNANKLYINQFTKSYSIDLSVSSEVVEFGSWLRKENIGVDSVICCAGSSLPKLFTHLSIEDIDKGIDINYKTCVYLLHVLIPFIRESQYESRNVVILSSSVAFYSFIGYTQYAPLKCALKSLSDSLRHELGAIGIKVTTVFPGNFASEGYAEENQTKPSITSDVEGASTPISVEECADKIFNGLKHGTTYIHTDFIGWVLNSFSLGFSPRQWFPFQVIFALIGALFARLIDMYHEYLIKEWLSKNE